MKRFSLVFCLLLCGFTTIKNENTTPIKTPALQERKTAKIQLDNGLQAYIISDPGAEQSAAALAVSAGSWQDDPQYPGIAHYLEHLLFLGTKKYPEEDAFISFVGSNGGTLNAFTASDRTVYMFSINNNAFDGALDQFSHFFIDPLFNPSGVSRELHAVDQEHAKNIESDGWRAWMIFKAIGNPNSPNAKFNAGNAETLGKIPPAEVEKWWKEHYTASQMHLVVYSNEPIDKLIETVNKDFGPIAKRSVDNKVADVPLMSQQQMGHMIYIEPIQDLREVSLIWELPAWAVEDQGEKLPELLTYVLASGANNSLLESLKKDQLATSINAGIDRLSNTKAIYQLSIGLTKQGVEQLDTVIDRCFETINGLKETGIPKYIFEDKAKMARINYEWQMRANPYAYIMSNARALTYEDLSTYPSQTLFYESYQPKKINRLIDTLTPQSCAFEVIAPSGLTGVKPNREEKWLGGQYAAIPVSADRLNKLAHIKPTAKIGLPAPNPYIPEALEILAKNPQTQPKLLNSDDKGMLYYTDASEFEVPSISWNISFKSPLIDGTPKHTALLSLYIQAINDQMTTPLYFARNAGLRAGFGQGDYKLVYQISGFSPKASLLLQTALKETTNIQASEAQFNTYKETVVSSYQNAQKELPFRVANHEMSSLIYNDVSSYSSLEAAAQKVTYEEFVDFCSSVTKQMYAEGMLAGNLTAANADAIWDDMLTTLNSRAYPKKDQHEKQVYVLNEKNGPYVINEASPMQGNVAMLLVEQGEFSYKRAAAQKILGTALSDDFFKTLRTQQQTGYVAQGWNRREADELLQFFAVQSATHDPDDLLSRFELFLETFVKDFGAQFAKERFEQLREGEITTLTNPSTNLGDYAGRMDTFAFDKGGDFDYLQNIAKAARELTYDEIHEYAQEFFSRGNKKRLALLVNGAPTNNKFTYKEVTALSIKQWQK